MFIVFVCLILEKHELALIVLSFKLLTNSLAHMQPLQKPFSIYPLQLSHILICRNGDEVSVLWSAFWFIVMGWFSQIVVFLFLKIDQLGRKGKTVE